MKIHGVLNWFDESPSWLAACVASLAQVCDHVVAVDGRYSLFQHDMAASPIEQAETIVETAAGAGIPLTLYRPVEPYVGDEVEKRSLSLRLVLAQAEPMKDWLLVCDADCVITQVSPFLRHDLELCEEHAATVEVQEHLDVLNPAAPVAVAHMVSTPETSASGVTLFYRVLPGMRYEGTHYSLSGSVNGQKTWLWGHPNAVQPFDARHALTMRHRNTHRPIRRREQASAYYETRDSLGTEARPVR